jgi:hypothetical protein
MKTVNLTHTNFPVSSYPISWQEKQQKHCQTLGQAFFPSHPNVKGENIKESKSYTNERILQINIGDHWVELYPIFA